MGTRFLTYFLEPCNSLIYRGSPLFFPLFWSPVSGESLHRSRIGLNIIEEGVISSLETVLFCRGNGPVLTAHVISYGILESPFSRYLLEYIIW